MQIGGDSAMARLYGIARSISLTIVRNENFFQGEVELTVELAGLLNMLTLRCIYATLYGFLPSYSTVSLVGQTG